MRNKLENYQNILYTILVIFTKIILLHFSHDTDRRFQIKSMWIWNVHLYFCCNSIKNKAVPQNQLCCSSENIICCQWTCLKFVHFAFPIISSFIPLTHKTKVTNPNLLKSCKILKISFLCIAHRKKLKLYIFVIISREYRILNVIFQQW